MGYLILLWTAFGDRLVLMGGGQSGFVNWGKVMRVRWGENPFEEMFDIWSFKGCPIDF